MFRSLRRLPKEFWAAIAVSAVILGGCAALQAPEPVIPATPNDPSWSARDIQDHLTYLNGSATVGRTIGSAAMESAAQYAASRMQAYRLQPIYGNARALSFTTPVHRIRSTTLASVQRDSLVLQPGIDYIADSRTDSGAVNMRFMHVARTGDVAPFPTATESALAVMISGEAATPERLGDLASRGFRLALVVRGLAPVGAAQPTPGLLVMQITPEAAAWVLGLSAEQFDEIWDTDVMLRSLPRRLVATVDAGWEHEAEAINVGGYLAGRHPTLMRELVIVAAPLDSPRLVRGQRLVDVDDRGTYLTTLLEVARNEADVSMRWIHPVRSVLFVGLSGSRSGHQGLNAFLDRLPWERQHVKRIIFIGLDGEEEAVAREMLSRHGIPLEVVRHQESAPRKFVHANERQARRDSPVPSPAVEATAPDLSTITPTLLSRVERLSAEVQNVLYRHVGVGHPEAALGDGAHSTELQSQHDQ